MKRGNKRFQGTVRTLKKLPGYLEELEGSVEGNQDRIRGRERKDDLLRRVFMPPLWP